MERGGPVLIEEPITVKTLSAALGIKSSDIIGKLMKQGIFVTVNQGLDRETAGFTGIEARVPVARRSGTGNDERELAGLSLASARGRYRRPGG